MKTLKLSFFLIISFLSFESNAQQAKEILGIANEQKELQYYQNQSELWKEKLSINSKDRKAWVNYYKAKRAIYQKKDYKFWVENRAEIFKKLEPILDDLYKELPDSFEYYWLKSGNTVNKEEAFKLASKAYNISPERKETYEELFIYYMTRWQTENAATIAQKILKSNFYANALYQWNLNSLNVANPQSILITHGDLDTLPRWVLQTGKSIRNDVLIINPWLMVYSKEYLKGVFLKLNIPSFYKSVLDFKNKEIYKNKLLKYIIDQVGKTRTIHFDCGTDVKLFETLNIKEKMYLTGVSFTYSNEVIDNLKITKHNFEEVLYLDYLFSDFQMHPQSDIVKKTLNISYIPGLMKMKSYYTTASNQKMIQKYDSLINKILEDSGRKEEILSWYE
ncbi:hypothetical protein [Wenyingzhuangia marina]|uniref:Uncharacterized protein n=1 Tax=Wenyingzhuangia marina TaxID=1195760 RepID=A0A1M5SWZ3_9FLAO|nr:hypothetical protein [Wenyingzhuangia marina]GGF64527.1 hypothetical protein GCM10011397_04330 [Wenyingzhuangia marina]SHH43037.1 hypothetical protein SAMN05444281_0575 [Wenyingzhuangia marina]